mgnify:CR=1 FL=1
MVSVRSYFQVLYGHTDRMGVMYYGHYPLLFELGRTDWIKSLGFRYRSMEDEWKVALPVLEMQVRYVKPAQYDDRIEIISKVGEMPGKIIVFDHELFNPQRQLINKAQIKLGFYCMQKEKLVDCPSKLKKRIAEAFESNQANQSTSC